MKRLSNAQAKKLSKAKRLARMQAKRRVRAQSKKRVRVHDYAAAVSIRSNAQVNVAYFFIVAAIAVGFLVSGSEELSVLATGAAIAFVLGVVGVYLSSRSRLT